MTEPHRVDGSLDSVNGVLVQLFAGHGVDAVRHEDVVAFPGHPGLWANGELYRGDEWTCQLDVRLGGFDGDRVLIESVAGIGEDPDAQANFALQAFANASFHVLLPAFFGQPECHGTNQVTWEIGGRPRTVFIGLVTTVFGYPGGEENPDLGFMLEFGQHLKAQPLPPGTHWVRLYQMRHQGEVLSNEVLLDNAPWEPLQDAMVAYDWPVHDDPYDVRMFLVIRDP